MTPEQTVHKGWFQFRQSIWLLFEVYLFGRPRKWFAEFLFSKDELSNGIHYEG